METIKSILWVILGLIIFAFTFALFEAITRVYPIVGIISVIVSHLVFLGLGLYLEIKGIQEPYWMWGKIERKLSTEQQPYG